MAFRQEKAYLEMCMVVLATIADEEEAKKQSRRLKRRLRREKKERIARNNTAILKFQRERREELIKKELELRLSKLKSRPNRLNNRKKPPKIEGEVREDTGIDLLQEVGLKDNESFRKWMRLDREQFLEVYELLKPSIAKKDTRMRSAVSARKRLAITLRHLATGESQTGLSNHFRVSQNLISGIIPEVCEALYKTLQPSYMTVPTTEDGWRKVSGEFRERWGLPMCLGSLNGKRVVTEYPSPYDIILLALVDADYKFLYVEVGMNETPEDTDVWDKSVLKKGIEDDMLGIPAAEPFPNSQIVSPYVIVADDAFVPTPYLVKPYQERDLSEDKTVCNYRLAKTKTVSDNAFGILLSNFHVFKTSLRTAPPRVHKIVLATLVLHNYLRTKSKDTYSPVDLVDREDVDNRQFVPGKWHDTVHNSLKNLKVIPQTPSQEALEVRDAFCAYLNGDGQIPYQSEMAAVYQMISQSENTEEDANDNPNVIIHAPVTQSANMPVSRHLSHQVGLPFNPSRTVVESVNMPSRTIGDLVNMAASPNLGQQVGGRSLNQAINMPSNPGRNLGDAIGMSANTSRNISQSVNMSVSAGRTINEAMSMSANANRNLSGAISMSSSANRNLNDTISMSASANRHLNQPLPVSANPIRNMGHPVTIPQPGQPHGGFQSQFGFNMGWGYQDYRETREGEVPNQGSYPHYHQYYGQHLGQ